jgi:NAD(P)-dependent dehydrogenase (short-subunit alcohol dehydrogenase family)
VLDVASKNPSIDVWILDLVSFSSDAAFADKVNKELERLDIAVLNAAVTKASFTTTSDGWEESLQVNTLSTVLLGIPIMPKLRATANMDHSLIYRVREIASRVQNIHGEHVVIVNYSFLGTCKSGLAR